MLFKEVTSAYIEKCISTLRQQNGQVLIVKVGGTHSVHWTLNG
jgi:hypothetical protein